jgi:hypothetical protein
MQLRAMFRTAASEEELTDAIQAGYARWRRETDAVAESYRRWKAAACDERSMAYAAYASALDREERAASACQDLVEHVRGS